MTRYQTFSASIVAAALASTTAIHAQPSTTAFATIADPATAKDCARPKAKHDHGAEREMPSAGAVAAAPCQPAALLSQDPHVPSPAPATGMGVGAGERLPSSPEPAQTATGPASYRSVFTDYRSYNEQAVLSWRESIELVGRIGGWQSYAREAQSSVPAGGSSASPATDDAPAAVTKPAATAAPSAANSGGHIGHSKP